MSRRERRQQDRLDRPVRERPRVASSKTRRPSWQSPLFLVTLAAVVVGGALVLLSTRPQPASSGGSLFGPPTAYATEIVSGESVGSAEAPVVLEVYSDFQCPVCARFVRDQFPTLKRQFVDAGVLRIESHDIAILGTGSPDESVELATGARCAAAQNRYWQFHDLVFWNQGGENRGDHDAAYLAAVANRAGVDRGSWDTCMAGDAVRNSVRADTSKALGVGINATPTVILNGSGPVPGLPDAASLIARIQELAAAAGASGSPASSTTP